MIRRIVKMVFQEAEVKPFLSLFEKVQPTIESFAGCHKVEVLQDVSDPTIIFTYSLWDSDADLQAYRQSDFFAATWKSTKALFADRPEAWSVQEPILTAP